MNRRRRGEVPEVNRATAGYHVVVSAWVPGERPLPVEADLRYDSADPYAVCLSLHVGGSSTLDWTFARELLADGIYRPIGIGDVVVEPVHTRRGELVRITLRSPAGVLHIQLPARAVLSFVQRTLAIVRLGAEERHVDLDDVARRLTCETG